MYLWYWLRKNDPHYSVEQLERQGMLIRFKNTFLVDATSDDRDNDFDDPEEQLVENSEFQSVESNAF